MGRRSVLLLTAGVLLLAVSVLLPDRPPPCLVRDGGTCLDARLTGRADGYVSSIDSETPGVPLWYITFEAAGATVQAKVADWPPAPGGPANGPRVGSTVHVAYDPAAPAEHATDADALAALQADIAAGREGGKASFLAIGVRWFGVALMVLSGHVLRDERRRRASGPVPAGPGSDGGAAPEPPQ
jgi:hypothetical protein